jgi:hypothetical protein
MELSRKLVELAGKGVIDVQELCKLALETFSSKGAPLTLLVR